LEGDYTADSANDIVDDYLNVNKYGTQYFSDIDGDTLSEKMIFDDTCSGKAMMLSSSGEIICFPLEIERDFCQNSAGFLLPSALN
jgi:hypothetical protein